MSKIVIFNYSLCLKKFVGLQTSQSKQACQAHSSLFLYFILGRFGRNVGGALISADRWIMKNLCKSQQNFWCTIIWKLICINQNDVCTIFSSLLKSVTNIQSSKIMKKFKWLHVNHVKGQLILKCLFCVFNFFQKMNKNTLHSSIMNSFVQFLEEFTAWQFAFEISWPLIWICF